MNPVSVNLNIEVCPTSFCVCQFLFESTFWWYLWIGNVVKEIVWLWKLIDLCSFVQKSVLSHSVSAMHYWNIVWNLASFPLRETSKQGHCHNKYVNYPVASVLRLRYWQEKRNYLLPQRSWEITVSPVKVTKICVMIIFIGGSGGSADPWYMYPGVY